MEKKERGGAKTRRRGGRGMSRRWVSWAGETGITIERDVLGLVSGRTLNSCSRHRRHLIWHRFAAAFRHYSEDTAVNIIAARTLPGAA